MHLRSKKVSKAHDWFKNNVKVKSGETVKAIDLVKVGVHLCFHITAKGQMIIPD